MISKKLLQILMFLFIVRANAQQLTVHVSSSLTGNSLSAVVLDSKNRLVTVTNAKGFCDLKRQSGSQTNQLRVHCIGYQDYYLRNETVMSDTIEVSLDLLIAGIRETVVTARRSGPESVIKNYKEWIIDYCVSGDGILIASYTGFARKKAKLLLLNDMGDTLTTRNLDFEPESLVMGCDGRKFITSEAGVHEVYLQNNELMLGKKETIRQLKDYLQCELVLKGNLYFKSVDPFNFQVIHGRLAPKDTLIRPYYVVTDSFALRGSSQDINALNAGHVFSSQLLGFSMMTLNRLHVEKMNVPLFSKSDTVVAFDLPGQCINYLNIGGTLLKKIILKDYKRNLIRLSVISDPVAQRFYLLGLEGKYQTLREIDMTTGKWAADHTILREPFARKVTIYNNRIYYISRNIDQPVRQRLFVQ